MPPGSFGTFAGLSTDADALTFGYIAGRHCAGVTDYENPAPVPQNDGV